MNSEREVEGALAILELEQQIVTPNQTGLDTESYPAGITRQFWGETLSGLARNVLCSTLPVLGSLRLEFLIFSVCLFSQLMASWKKAR